MLGGTPEELALVEVALAALAEKFEVCRRPRPAILDRVAAQLGTWKDLQAPTPVLGDSWDEDAPMGPLLLTYSEAAHMTRLSVNTIERAARAGRLRVVREGRAVRIRPCDLEAFVAGLGGEPAGLEVR